MPQHQMWSCSFPKHFFVLVFLIIKFPYSLSTLFAVNQTFSKKNTFGNVICQALFAEMIIPSLLYLSGEIILTYLHFHLVWQLTFKLFFLIRQTIKISHLEIIFWSF